eukprot:PhF_6_TR38586/c0_g1_i2/m.57349
MAVGKGEAAQQGGIRSGPLGTLLQVQTKLKDLYLRIGKNRKMTKVFLQLTGSVTPLERHVLSYLERYKFLSHLWSGYRADEIERFHRDNPKLEEYENKLMFYDSVLVEINGIPNQQAIGCLKVDLSAFKNRLEQDVKEWKLGFAGVLYQRVRTAAADVTSQIEEIESRLCRQVSELADVNVVMATIRFVRAKEVDMQNDLIPLMRIFGLLQKIDNSYGRDDQENIDALSTRWDRIVRQSHDAMDNLQKLAPQFKSMLWKGTQTFTNSVKALKRDYDTQGPMCKDIGPRVAMDRLRHFQKQFDDRQKKLIELRMGEELFATQHVEFPEMIVMEKELVLLGQVY